MYYISRAQHSDHCSRIPEGILCQVRMKTQKRLFFVSYRKTMIEDFLCTGEVVALKKLKMEKEKEGFPITSLREINTLLKSQHPNIVTVQV